MGHGTWNLNLSKFEVSQITHMKKSSIGVGSRGNETFCKLHLRVGTTKCSQRYQFAACIISVGPLLYLHVGSHHN